MLLHAKRGKTLHIIFLKVDRYNRKYESTKYLALFHSDEKKEKVYDRIRYAIMLKSNILDIYFINIRKLKLI